MTTAKEKLEGRECPAHGSVQGREADDDGLQWPDSLRPRGRGRFHQPIKELTAVAIAAATGCEDCIVYHLAAAKKHGATREELAEMLAVSVEMAGGPGAVYAAKAIAYFDELA